MIYFILLYAQICRAVLEEYQYMRSPDIYEALQVFRPARDIHEPMIVVRPDRTVSIEWYFDQVVYGISDAGGKSLNASIPYFAHLFNKPELQSRTNSFASEITICPYNQIS